MATTTIPFPKKTKRFDPPFNAEDHDSKFAEAWWRWLDELEAKNAAFPVGGNKRAIPPYWEKDSDGNPRTADAATLEEHIEGGGHIGIIPARLGCLVVDIDSKPGAPDHAQLDESVPFVLQKMGPPVVQYQTPSGGFHSWYRTDIFRFNHKLYMNGQLLGDLRCERGYVVVWDVERLWLGLKDGWHDADPVDKAFLKHFQKVPSKPAAKPAPKPTAAEAQEGERNDCLNRQAYLDLKASRTPAEAANALLNNLEDALIGNANPLTLPEALRTLRSAAKGALGEAATDARLPRQWEPEVRKRVFLVPMIAQRGKTTRICGAPKVGKSVVLASLMARMTRKGASLPGGIKSAGFRVLYLPLEEDTAEDVNPRLIAAKADFRNLRTIDGLTGLIGAGFVSALMESVRACADWQPDIIAIDPLAAFMRKINDADSARDTLTSLNDIAAQFNAALLIVDHNAKMTKRRMTETDNIADLAAGSVQATATVRLQWLIHKSRKEPDAEPLLIYAGGNADWKDSNRPPTEYRLHSEAKEVAPGCVGRYIETFEPTSGNAEAMIAEANGRVAPCEAEDAIRELVADGRFHLLTEIEDMSQSTLRKRATRMANEGELECMNARQAKKDGRLDADVPNNRAKAYAKTDTACT